MRTNVQPQEHPLLLSTIPMEFDLRTLLMVLPDQKKSQEFLVRLDTEGPTEDLIDDVVDFMQSEIDSTLDAMGVPAVDDNDPALAEARAHTIAQTQNALDVYQRALDNLVKRTDEASRGFSLLEDEQSAERLKKEISEGNPAEK